MDEITRELRQYTEGPPSCIHVQRGLCDDCQAEYDEDPSAYYEYGDHPQGIANWQALQAEMDAEASRPVSPAGGDSDIPF